MRTLSCIALLLTCTAPAMAQEAFEADLLLPCLDGSELVVTCSPEVGGPPLRLVGAADWVDHLLRLEDPEGARWIVRRRLNLRLAASWAPGPTLRLTAGLDGVPHQRGQGTDALGAPRDLAPDLGRFFLSALWSPWAEADGPVGFGLVSRLVSPLGRPESLTGPGDLRWHGEIWLGLRTPWVQPFVNLGVALGESQRYRKMTRDQALLARLGVFLGQPDWPLGAGIEAQAQTRLEAPFAQRVNSPVEMLFSLHFRGLSWMQGQLVAGLGATGPAVPRYRLGLVLSWPLGRPADRQKRTVAGE